MALHKLADLSGWELEDSDQDIRGRPLINASGKEVGVIKDLAVDLDTQHVIAVVTDMGESYAVDGLDIGPDRVTTEDPPISGGTSREEESPARSGGYVVRIIRLT